MLRAMEPEYEKWWRERTRGPAPGDAGHVAGLLNEAIARFRQAMWIQLRVTYLAQGIFDQLAGLAESVGTPGLERRLVAGYGDLVEGRMVRDLHALGHSRLDLGEFRRRWGFHGPREGELMSRPWREDVSALERAVASYVASDPEEPDVAADERARLRRYAESEFLAACGHGRRIQARALIRLARAYVPLREVGKAAYVQAIDAGRAAARGLGSSWHRDGVLGDPDDIFFLTIPEIGRAAAQPIGEIVEARRRRHQEYEALTLPRTWTGMPQPIPLDRVTSTVDALTGVPVSAPATVEGTARVVTDPSSDDPLDAEEILVCDTTDPSWVSLFVSAAALVIDIGGPLSHGAIVARELGIPAVVNTGDGTRAIRTGDRIRVDGKDGRIEILARAEPVEVAA